MTEASVSANSNLPGASSTHYLGENVLTTDSEAKRQTDFQ